MRILQRRVLIDLLQVFTGVVIVLTLMLLVVGVIGEAVKNGLGPVEILKILPYIVPSLLPFTIPATLLLTVCVVYGRMSGDQEVTAMKSAGINVIEILWPAFILGAMLSLATLLLTDLFVPWSMAKIKHVYMTSMENIFLDVLRTTSQFNDPNRGIAVTARRVDGRRLIDATFRYTLPGGGGKSALITAREATIQFDLENQQVLLNLKDGHMETPGGTQMMIKENEQRSFPMPIESNGELPPRNMAIQTIRRELTDITAEDLRARERRIIDTAFSLSTGRFDELAFLRQNEVDRKFANRTERRQKLVTEIHNRIAMACGCFFFALVGSPFAIQQGKRQFLTSFAICFAPILLLYYPAVLLLMNLSREGIINPAWGTWVGNAGLAVAAGFVLRKVLRH